MEVVPLLRKIFTRPSNLPTPHPPFPATSNRKLIPFVLSVLICNKYTYSDTLDNDVLLAELGYFFTCSVFQSLANKEINSEPQSNLEIITHAIYTQTDAVYEGRSTLRRF